MLSPVSTHEVNKFRQRDIQAQAAQRRLAFSVREEAGERSVKATATLGQRLRLWLRGLRLAGGRRQATR
jgi:hypothetical protein